MVRNREALSTQSDTEPSGVAVASPITITENLVYTTSDVDNVPQAEKRNKYLSGIQNFHTEHRRLINILLFVTFNILAVIYFIFASIFEYDDGVECNTDACRAKWCRGYGTLLIIYVIFYVGCFYHFLFKPFIAGFLIKLWGKVQEKHGKWIKM